MAAGAGEISDFDLLKDLTEVVDYLKDNGIGVE
jgi:hypothetical protein